MLREPPHFSAGRTSLMANGTKAIMEKLDEIKVELDEIKGKMADVDVVLTEDDVESLKAAEKDSKEGKTKRLN